MASRRVGCAHHNRLWNGGHSPPYICPPQTVEEASSAKTREPPGQARWGRLAEDEYIPDKLCFDDHDSRIERRRITRSAINSNATTTQTGCQNGGPNTAVAWTIKNAKLA